MGEMCSYGKRQSDRLAALVRGEFGLATEALAVCLGARPAFARAGADQLAFEPARPPRTVNINRPCGVVVSAHVSASERNPAFFSVTAASVFDRSRVAIKRLRVAKVGQVAKTFIYATTGAGGGDARRVVYAMWPAVRIAHKVSEQAEDEPEQWSVRRTQILCAFLWFWRRRSGVRR